MARREIMFAHCTLIIRPYCLQKLLILVDECRRYSKPKQCRFREKTKKTQFSGFMLVSPGRAETLVMIGGITNHHLIHTLSATSLPKTTIIG